MNGQNKGSSTHNIFRHPSSGIIRNLLHPNRFPTHLSFKHSLRNNIHIHPILACLIHIARHILQRHHTAAPAAGPVPAGREFAIGAHVVFPAQPIFGPGGHQGIVRGLFQLGGILAIPRNPKHLPAEVQPLHHGAGLGALVGRPFGRAVEQLPAEVDASPGAAQSGEVRAADGFPGVGAGGEEGAGGLPVVAGNDVVGAGNDVVGAGNDVVGASNDGGRHARPDRASPRNKLIRLRHPGQAAQHLVNLPVPDQRHVVPLARQRNQLQAGSVVQLEDAAFDHLPNHRRRPQHVQVAEGIQHAASRHSAVLPGLGDLDALLEHGPAQELHYLQRAVGVLGIARRHRRLGESLDQVGHDPGIPVHRHRLGRRAVVVALVFAVAAQVAILLLTGDEIVCDRHQFAQQHRVARALIGLGGGVEPLSGVLALPSSLTLGYHLRGEEVDGVAVGAGDVLREAAVVAHVDGVAQHAADHDR